MSVLVLGSAASSLLAASRQLLEVGEARLGPDTRLQPDEGQLGTGLVGIAAPDRPLEGGRQDARGDERSGAHRGVVGHEADVADGGEGGDAHDLEPGRRDVDGKVLPAQVGDGHRVADALVELGQRRRAQHDLVPGVEAVAGQDRWGHRRARPGEEDRHALPVDVEILVIGPAPGGDIGVVVDEPLRVRREGVARIEQVAPVPPVEGGVRHQRLEAAGKGERRDDEGDRHDRSQERGAHGGCVAAPPRFEREAHADGRRHRQARRLGAPHDARAPGDPARFAGQAVRRPEERQRHRGRPEHDDEDRQAEAEHRPVEGDPAVGVDGADRAEGGERRQPHRHADRQQRPEHDGAHRGDRLVAPGRARSRPEGAQHRPVVVLPAELAGDRLDPEHEADQGRDRAERAERQGLGLEGELHIAHHARRHVEVVGRAGWDECGEPALGGEDVARVVELYPVEDGHDRRRGKGERLAGEGRGQLQQAVGAVDVVLDELVVELHDPDHPGLDPPERGARG